MSFKKLFRLLALVVSLFSMIVYMPVSGVVSTSKIPLGYTKWNDGSEFAYKWITKMPKDDYYNGVWQGVATTISVVYVRGFSCSPELPDGTTNSVEVKMDFFKSGNIGLSGRGYANTTQNSGPFKIKITFYGASKGDGAMVRQVKLKTIKCRM